MKAKQSGFTLIELVVVIVILGILAAVALPKFIDLSSEARQAAAKGVASSISSASALNYGARKVSSSKGTAVSGTVCSAGTLGPLLTGGVPAGYTITGDGECTTDGGTAECGVQDSNDTSVVVSATIVCSN